MSLFPSFNLTYPDPDRTTRPDIPTADAYVIDGLDYEVIDGDYFTLPFACDVEPDESVTPLVLLSSFDHGLRTADETALVVGIECAASVLVPVILALDPSFTPSGVDWTGLALDVIGADWTGDGWCDDPDGSESIYGWSDDMQSAAGSAGLVVESSADSGMTWIYAPLCAPIERQDEDEDHEHRFTGPIKFSRLAGTPHRECDTIGCNVISLPDDEDEHVEDERPSIPLDHSDVVIGTRYMDSSGDHRVTIVYRYVGWSQITIEPDDYRGTPGRARRDFTIMSTSYVLRNFRND